MKPDYRVSAYLHLTMRLTRCSVRALSSFFLLVFLLLRNEFNVKSIHTQNQQQQLGATCSSHLMTVTPAQPCHCSCFQCLANPWCFEPHSKRPPKHPTSTNPSACADNSIESCLGRIRRGFGQLVRFASQGLGPDRSRPKLVFGSESRQRS